MSTTGLTKHLPVKVSTFAYVSAFQTWIKFSNVPAIIKSVDTAKEYTLPPSCVH